MTTPAKIKAIPKFKKFTYVDLFVSATARKNKIPNIPNEEQQKNLEIMLEFLNILKETTINDFSITSCFRSKELNDKIGGLKNSFHLQGLACDLTCKDLDQLVKLIRFQFANFKKGKNLFVKIYAERKFLHFHFLKV